MMEVFGEEYDLESCTPEERAEVEEWYEKNKDNMVPQETDGRWEEEFAKGCLDIYEMLSKRPRDDFGLVGNERHLDFYRWVHPCGLGTPFLHACKQFDITHKTGYNWLNKLKRDNPEKYDYDKWPSKPQIDAYVLIHPELGGCTQEQAARLLNITQQAIQTRLSRMRKTHYDAFSFERVAKPRMFQYNPSRDDENIVQKF